MVRPEVVQFPPANPVPIYDVRNHNGMGLGGVDENVHSSLPPHKSHSLVYCAATDNLCALGFTVSVPLKQYRRTDIISRAEIAFQWDVLYGNFYDHICARMDLDPKEVILGYKFELDPKKNMIQLPQNAPDVFDTMLKKTKSHIAHARTHTVVLEIHNLVHFMVQWSHY